MQVFSGLHVDITLKDVQTVQGKRENLRRWVQVVREAVDDNYQEA